MNQDNTITCTFKVASFRKLPNPYEKSELGEKNAVTYMAICDVKLIPENIPMQTNPREQKLTTNVAKKIKASLLSNEYYDFYQLNRGILISADEVSFNNYSNELTVSFSDFELHGNVDGGHTYKIILENRDKLSQNEQFVKLEILTGVEDIFQRLAAARNTSVQVQDKSIAELENRFEIIKKGIKKETFSTSVYFKENDTGDIDVAEILAILNMFNITRYSTKEDVPIVSYSGKKKCIDYYIADHKEYKESNDNPYVKMLPIIVDIFKLYDIIESNMNSYYRRTNSTGRYGAVKGVHPPKGDRELKTKFYKNNLDYSSPTGFLYPLLGAFRALVKEKNGVYIWTKSPYDVLAEVGPELVGLTVERSRSLGNNPQSVGKDSGHWKTLFMTVGFSLME